MSESHFTNQHDNLVIGVIVSRGFQPITGAPIVRIQVTEGPEKGMLYWVPTTQVKEDGVLGVLARI